MKFRNIGDVLLSTPLVSNLKYYYPDSKIDFLLNKGCEDMVYENTNIYNVIVYDRPRIKKLKILAQLLEEIYFTHAIRKKNYDIVINLTEGERGAQIAFFSGAKIKLGFPVRKGLLSLIGVFDKLGDDKKWQHTVEKDLQFVNLLGKEIVSKEVIINWNRDIDEEVNQILKENSVQDFVHIHPVSRWMFKCWENDRMAKIIDYFEEEKNLKVIITGSFVQKELDRINQIIAFCKTKPINLSGKLTLKHLACLSSRSKLFFGVDSAPMHIAAATGTPVLTIFGASFPVLWGPWKNNVEKQLFLDIDGIQMNGSHCMVSMMNHDIVYEDSVKKSRGMVLIDYDKVRSALDLML